MEGMLCFVVFCLLVNLCFGAQVPICKAVSYSGTFTDCLTNLNIYNYGFILATVANDGNITFPNNLTISDYSYSSSNNYYPTSPLTFIFEKDYPFIFQLSNESGTFSFPNGWPRFYFGFSGLNGNGSVFDYSQVFVNDGTIFDGLTGAFFDPVTNPCFSRISQNCGAYPFIQKQTICCTEYDYVNIPDSDEDQCLQFESSTTITDEPFAYIFDIEYNVTSKGLNMTVTQIYPPDYNTFYYFGPLNVYGYCYANATVANSNCFKAFPVGDFQDEMIFSFYASPNQGAILAYEGAIVGELIRRNGMFLKNMNEPFTPEHPCWTRKSGFVNNNATVESLFCCIKFESETKPISTTPPVSTFPPTPQTSSTAAPVSSTPPTTFSSNVTSTPSTFDPRSNAIGSLCSNDTSKAWLDIVFVIDCSSSMSRKNFNAIAGEIATYMETFTFGQTGNHTTRVAVITYSANSVIQYELINTTNYENFIDFLFYSLPNNVSFDNNGGNVRSALLTAYDLLLFQKSFRKPVIILIAAAYDRNGFQGADKTANTIKNNGIPIIVINFATTDGILTTALENIASPGYYYISNQDPIYLRIPYALTQMNCFCPPNSLQFKEYNNAWKNYTNYGDCFFGFTGETSPDNAERVCEPGTLVALTSHQKLDFITDHVLPHELPGKRKFTIGLHKSSDLQWKWWGYNKTEYALGNFPSMSDIPLADDNYGYMWNHYGFNWTLQTGNNVPLPYICQAQACDASYICDLKQLTKLKKTMQKRKQFH